MQVAPQMLRCAGTQLGRGRSEKHMVLSAEEPGSKLWLGTPAVAGIKLRVEAATASRWLLSTQIAGKMGTLVIRNCGLRIEDISA